MTRFHTSLIALATLLAPAAVLAGDGSPVARYHLEQAWPMKTAPDVLSDLPVAPRVNPGPPNTGTPGRGQIGNPNDKSLGGPDTAPGAAKPNLADGKYAIKKLPGRPR
jgi:hypothetical protein